MSNSLKVSFTNPLWYWRGPSPFYFVSVPKDESQKIKDISGLVTYGWGAIPVRAISKKVEWSTSIFPKDGSYIVPIKKSVRDALELSVDSVIEIALLLDFNPRI